MSREKVFKGDFLKHRRVFVTGHSGFKGSWLTLTLKELGAKVSGYSLCPNTQPSMYEALSVGTYCAHDYIDSDIRDYIKLQNALKEADPEIIFHLGAQPIVIESYHDPITTYETNVMGTLNVLNIARDLKNVRAVVCITTDKVYENNEWMHSYRESDRLGGKDPYSASKACSELVIHSHRSSFFENSHCLIASARAGNVIGGGDWSEYRLVPDLMRHIYFGKEIKLRNPDSVRPWQHVMDPILGYIMLAQKLYEGDKNFAGSWNFGPNHSQIKTVRQVVDSIENILQTPLNLVIESLDYKESNLLLLDSGLANRLLKWESFIEYEEAISLTTHWYKNYYENKDRILDFTQKQIREILGR